MKKGSGPYKTGPFPESIPECNCLSQTSIYSNVPKYLIVLTIWLV